MAKSIIPKTEFARNVLTLMTGTTLAQAIPVAISPILTRLYSPEEMGSFALYISVVAVISIVATGKYEQAIMLPKTNAEAANLTALTLIITAAVSLLLLGIVIIFHQQINTALDHSVSPPWLLLVPLSVSFTGIYQSLNFWSNRKKYYKRMALSRVVQSGAMCSTHIGTGLSNIGSSGLISGVIIGQLISILTLGKFIWQEDRYIYKKISQKKIWLLARRYNNFPKLTLPGSMLNSASIQSPIFLLTALFSPTAVGFYMLTQRVISSPIGIIAQAIGSVFRQEASQAYIKQGQCLTQYNNTFKKLFTIATPLFIIFFFIAPSMFEIVFGSQWRTSGQYAQVLAPMFYLKFIFNPLSTMFLIAEKQKLNLFWQLALFCCTLGSFTFGYLFFDIFTSLIAFSASYSTLYIVNGLMTWNLAKGHKKVTKRPAND